jgi:Lar family restriction alleviation protein
MTNKTDSELLPCPFCGGKPRKDIIRTLDINPNLCSIECSNCGVEFTNNIDDLSIKEDDKIMEMLMEKWNTRV